MKTVVLVNPKSGGGRALKVHQNSKSLLDDLYPNAQYFFSKQPGDIKKQSVQFYTEGVGRYILIGGDGTINECVNALAGVAKPGECELGILSGGSGCDFVRSLGQFNSLKSECRRLTNANTINCDVLSATTDSGKCFYALNGISFGMGGLVAKLVEGWRKKPWPNQWNYFLGGAAAYARNFRVNIEIRHKQQELFYGPIQILLFVNGRFSGNGMQWSKSAKLDSGEFELLLVEPLSYLRIPTLVKKVYCGEVTEMKEVHSYNLKECDVKILEASKNFFETDGECQRAEQVHISILPKFFKIIA